MEKYKARKVAKGFSQVLGIGSTETFSPIIKPPTIWTVLIATLHKGWGIRQFYVYNAFLNGELIEEVDLEQPLGFVDSNFPNMVYRLHKALYGLKATSRGWFDKLYSILLSLGFHSSKADQFLFIKITS